VKPIDARVFEHLRGLEARGRPGLLDKITRAFGEVAATGAETMRDALARRDAEALWRAAHKLKSAAGAVGARRVAARCAMIEKAGRAGLIESAAGAVGKLGTDVAVALAWLRMLAAAPAVTGTWPASRTGS
jgi:HPt (histidine-containing phosphotransfer) domain-containing protein